MNFVLKDKKFKINVIYGPPDRDNPDFFSLIPQHNPIDPEEHVINIGDWNVIQSTTLDRDPNQHPYYKKHSNSKIWQICHDHELVDPWRFRNPHEKFYSWKQHNHPRHSRIDYALINSDANAIVSSVSYSEPPFYNDHKIFNINFELGKYQQGKGYFRISNHLYYDLNFVSKVNDMIDSTLANSTQSPENVLDYILFNTSTIAKEHITLAKIGRKKVSCK